MASYNVRFNLEALRDIENSLQWGYRNWGEEQAMRWVRGLYSVVQKRLTSFPLSCPLAPESAEHEREVRQLIYDRYRILFFVQGDEVSVLYVQGPFHS